MSAAFFHFKEPDISREDPAGTPLAVLNMLSRLIGENAALRRRVEELEAKLDENSSNSNKPPSSDSPYKKKPRSGKSNKFRKKRRGYRQEFMSPTETREIFPSVCSCGCSGFENLRPIIRISISSCPKS
jgi:transposase